MLREWDDNEFPVAYFITFRTYGTWLHGDERGSIDRYHNKFRGPRVPNNPVMENQQFAKLKSEPVILNQDQRRCVETAIRGVCEYRKWKLQAINVRTNHGHVVVWAGVAKAESVLRDFKAYSTRELRDSGLWLQAHSPWCEGGSKRYLWSADSVWHACEYVVNGQGDNLPESF